MIALKRTRANPILTDRLPSWKLLRRIWESSQRGKEVREIGGFLVGLTRATGRGSSWLDFYTRR